MPLISKADMLTPKEIKKFKKKILEEIAKNQIRIYQVCHGAVFETLFVNQNLLTNNNNK